MHCGHMNSCGFRKSIKEFFNLNFQEESNQANGYMPYFEAHGLDVGTLIESGIIGKDLSLRLAKIEDNVFYKKLAEVDGKPRWKNPRGYKAKYGSFYPALHESKTLYVFGGEWDWFKGIQDGLACTSSLFGEGYLPQDELGWAVFAPFEQIKICYDSDRAGRIGSGKLSIAMRKQFPEKSIEIIRLSFTTDQTGKDYCDWRHYYSIDDFLCLVGVPIDQQLKNLMKAEKNAEKAEAKKQEIAERGPQWKNILRVVGKFLVTDRGIFKQVEYPNGIVDYEKVCDDAVLVIERLEDITGQECHVKLSWNGVERIFAQDSFLTKNFDLLVRAGLRVLTPNQKDMAEYFLAALGDTEITKPFSTRNGWFGEKFIKGNQIITKDSVSEIGRRNDGPSIGSDGNEDLWIKTVTRFTNDPQVEIVLGASTIAPILVHLGIENFSLHFWQDSSCGKSFLAKLAASMWGKFESDVGSGLVQSWSSTYVGHEFYFHILKNIPCFLDESQLCHSQEMLEKTIYQFGNGYGKARGTKEKTVANLTNWRSVLISTGEKKITDSSNMAGLGARTIEIFRKKYEEISETEFRRVYFSLNQNYGMASTRIIQHFLSNQRTLEERYVEILEQMETDPQIQSIISANDIAKRLVPRWTGIVLGAQINQTLFGFQYKGAEVWGEMLKSFGEAQDKPTTTIYDTIVEIYMTNKTHFNRKPAKGGEIIEEAREEVWGFIDIERQVIFFFPEIFKRELKKRNFAYSQLSLLSEDRLLRDSQKKNQVSQKYLGRSVRFVGIVLEV